MSESFIISQMRSNMTISIISIISIILVSVCWLKENQLESIDFTAFLTWKCYNKVHGFIRFQIFFRAVFFRKVLLKEWKSMYKCTDNTQSNFLKFNQPIGLHMNPENRWIKMKDAIPWEIFEKKYSRLFKGKNGRVAKPLRLAQGSLIIHTK